MSDIAIRVENLSKAYRIGLKEQRHETLAGAVASFVRAPWQNYQNLRKLSKFDDARLADERSKTVDGSLPTANSQLPTPSSLRDDVFWALKNVSFEVKHGEVLGIIGRNGAGKSTLLKILSRITEPTSGCATIYGRVASLLEVGTGFHPDLTGRENVYLNGTILGMRKNEVDRKFDEIVAFSEVEKFIDTPVKRYSSGMRVRLAFAVAAHLEPEILIIDEVLAVGDAAFQKKCLGKMQDVASHGRTVLFVSHNMSAISELCTRSVVLDYGSILFSGPCDVGIERYVQSISTSEQLEGVSQDLSSWLTCVQVNRRNELKISAESPFEISVCLGQPLSEGSWLFLIMEDLSGRTVLHKRISASEIVYPSDRKAWTLVVALPALWLSAGVYTVYFKVLFSGLANTQQRVISDRVLLHVNGDLDNSGKSLLNPEARWKIA